MGYEFLVLPFGIRLIIFPGVVLVVRRDGGCGPRHRGACHPDIGGCRLQDLPQGVPRSSGSLAFPGKSKRTSVGCPDPPPGLRGAPVDALPRPGGSLRGAQRLGRRTNGWEQTASAGCRSVPMWRNTQFSSSFWGTSFLLSRGGQDIQLRCGRQDSSRFMKIHGRNMFHASMPPSMCIS